MKLSAQAEFCSSRKSVYSQSDIYRCMSSNPTSRLLEPYRLQDDPSHSLCYRPAVFFCHLRRFALSIPQGKIRRAFKKDSILGRKVSPFHRPQRPLGRVEVQLYSIFYLGTRRGWGVSVTPRPHLTPGKDSLPIVQDLMDFRPCIMV
jgi:hypothetical protein